MLAGHSCSSKAAVRGILAQGNPFYDTFGDVFVWVTRRYSIKPRILSSTSSKCVHRQNYHHGIERPAHCCRQIANSSSSATMKGNTTRFRRFLPTFTSISLSSSRLHHSSLKTPSKLALCSSPLYFSSSAYKSYSQTSIAPPSSESFLTSPIQDRHSGKYLCDHN